MDKISLNEKTDDGLNVDTGENVYKKLPQNGGNFVARPMEPTVVFHEMGDPDNDAFAALSMEPTVELTEMGYSDYDDDASDPLMEPTVEFPGWDDDAADLPTKPTIKLQQIDVAVESMLLGDDDYDDDASDPLMEPTVEFPGWDDDAADLPMEPTIKLQQIDVAVESMLLGDDNSVTLQGSNSFEGEIADFLNDIMDSVAAAVPVQSKESSHDDAGTSLVLQNKIKYRNLYTSYSETDSSSSSSSDGAKALRPTKKSSYIDKLEAAMYNNQRNMYNLKAYAYTYDNESISSDTDTTASSRKRQRNSRRHRNSRNKNSNKSKNADLTIDDDDYDDSSDDDDDDDDEKDTKGPRFAKYYAPAAAAAAAAKYKPKNADLFADLSVTESDPWDLTSDDDKKVNNASDFGKEYAISHSECHEAKKRRGSSAEEQRTSPNKTEMPKRKKPVKKQPMEEPEFPPKNCICMRGASRIRCKICNYFWIGRLHQECIVHPNMNDGLGAMYCLRCVAAKSWLEETPFGEDDLFQS